MNWLSLKPRSLVGLLPVVIVLGTATGAVCSAYSIVHGVLLRPLPYRDSEQIFRLWDAASEGGMRLLTARQFHTIRTAMPTAAIASYSPTISAFRLRDKQFISARTCLVSAQFFEVLGTPAKEGTTADFGDSATVIVSERLRLRGGPVSVGDFIDVDGSRVRVVAVMDSSFWFPDYETLVWRGVGGSPVGIGGRSGPVIMRPPKELSGGPLDVRLNSALAASRVRGNVRVETIREEFLGDVRTPLLMLQLTAVFVLVIALVNASLFLLNRTKRQERRFAIVAAIGGTPRHILAGYFLETILVAVGSMTVAVSLASLLLAIAPSMGAMNLPRFTEARVDSQVLLVTGLAALLGAVIAYVPPSLAAIRASVRCALLGQIQPYMSERRGLLVVLFGITFALTLQASLLSLAFRNFMSENVGFHDPSLVGLKLELPDSGDVGTMALRYKSLLDGLRSVNTIAATSNVFPLFDIEQMSSAYDARPLRGRRVVLAGVRAVSASYYSVCGVQVLAGTVPTAAESDEPVLVVNDVLARQVFGGAQEAIGKWLTLGDGEWKVVAVTAAIQHRALFVPATPEAYAPLEMFARFSPASVTAGLGTAFVIAPKGRSGDRTLQLLEDSVRQHFPEVKSVSRWHLQQLLWVKAGERPLLTLGATFMALLGLALMGLGIFANLSDSVRLQRRAIGVRLALGASPGRIAADLLRSKAPLVALGLVLGLGLFAMAEATVATAVFVPPGIERPGFVELLVAAASVHLIVLVIATLKPIGEAARVDPITVLRTD